jgi:hypothetical protein
MSYNEEEIERIIETTTQYHLMLQYLKEYVDEEIWKRSKEYAKDFSNDIEMEILDEDDDTEEYENYAED